MTPDEQANGTAYWVYHVVYAFRAGWGSMRVDLDCPIDSPVTVAVIKEHIARVNPEVGTPILTNWILLSSPDEPVGTAATLQQVRALREAWRGMDPAAALSVGDVLAELDNALEG